MDRTGPTRREFLSASTSALGGSWLAARLPLLAALSACAREAEQRGAPFETLSDAEARTLAAFGDQILPPGDAPGASDANVVRFVDFALAGPFNNLRSVVGDGLADLDRRAVAEGATDFATLSGDRQTAVVEQVVGTPFFGGARLLVIAGMFCDPSRGGNTDGAGWTLLGMEHAPAYQPPFGYYDAEAASSGGA